MIVYHASKHKFSFPDYKKLVANRENHGNGNLGLWCSIRTDWIKGFGKYTYKLDVRDAKSKTISVNQLMKFAPDNDFVKKRDELLEQGYEVLKIMESSGSVDMIVVLDFSAIGLFVHCTEADKVETRWG